MSFDLLPFSAFVLQSTELPADAGSPAPTLTFEAAPGCETHACAVGGLPSQQLPDANAWVASAFSLTLTF